MSDSPWDEHADERRPCPECGGTRTVQGLPCPLCEPPTEPDPAVFVKAHKDAAAHLRKLLRLPVNATLARLVREDIEKHKKAAATIEAKR